MALPMGVEVSSPWTRRQSELRSLEACFHEVKGSGHVRSCSNSGGIADIPARQQRATCGHGTYDFLIASGFATARACSMKSCATGLSVRFLSVTMPNGRRAIDSLMGKTLISGRRLGNLSTEVGTMERKRPVATRLIRASGEI